MKVFTHKYVIYDNGWVFEWEPKDAVTINVVDLMLTALAIYLIIQL